MELSVIIVSYNVRHFLEQCLNSVSGASKGIRCEVFVVDNNSADGSWSMVRTLFPEVTLIRNTCNAGFAKACNQALKAASGEFVLLLNPDTVVEENAFRKCIDFMCNHDDAGALGPMMIDGNGKFLRESKRSLPTPLISFYKMTGLTKLFPKSHLFSRYYMEHIGKDEAAEIEVLTGAFMFIRRKALEKTGLLDENFFMYGEDIDLSYRLTKAGFKIFYYPEVKIIHYKGQSSKESPANSTFHFYMSMLVFAEKHYREKDLLLFYLILKPAIYLHWSASMIRKFLLSVLPVITDAAVIFISVLFIINLWEIYKFAGSYNYPGYFTYGTSIAFSVFCIVAIYAAGGYRKQSGFKPLISGLIAGCILLMALFAILPHELRFSRAVILLGSFTVTITLPLARAFLGILDTGIYISPLKSARRTVIVSSRENYLKICELMSSINPGSKILGRVSISGEDLDKEVLGDIEQLKEIIKINRIGEVIFSLKNFTASQIISAMNNITSLNVKVWLAPEGEKLLIGSKQVTTTKA